MISTQVTIDSAELDAVLNQLPRNIFRAQRSAITTTTTWAKKEVQNRLIEQTGIPKSVFRRVRVKSKRYKESGKVWIGYNDIKAAYVGKLQDEPGGASAGQYYFEGGFIATMASGHTGIFKRAASGKLIEQTVTLTAGLTVGQEVAKQAEAELKRRFIDKLRSYQPELN